MAELAQHFQAFERFLRHGKPLASLALDSDSLPNDVLQQRALVYRNGFLSTCVSALASHYPVVQQLTGEAFFTPLALAFVQDNPPRQGSLVHYAQDFPLWLAQQHDKHRLAYLPDFAALDAAWMHCYFAKDETPLSAEQIQQLLAGGTPLNELPVSLLSASTLVCTEFDVLPVWRQLKDQQPLTQSASLPRQPSASLLWRSVTGQFHTQALSPAEHRFLDALKRGETLPDAAEQALMLDEHFALTEQWSALIQASLLCPSNRSQVSSS